MLLNSSVGLIYPISFVGLVFREVFSSSPQPTTSTSTKLLLQRKMFSTLISLPILSILTTLPPLTFAQSVTGCPPSYMGIGVHAGTHGTGFALLTNYTNCPPTPDVAPVIFLTDTHSLPTADPTGFCSTLDGVPRGGGGDEGVYGGGSIVDCITGEE
jgi:hypothetical protein